MTSGMLQETIPSTPSSVVGPKFRPYASPNHHVTKGRYITSNDPRGYIPVYEYPLNGQWIMMDIDDGYILWTGIWKALGNSKADIVKMIDSQPDLASMIRRVRGGYLKIQGTWMPYEVALRLSRRVAWPIRDDLVPLFGPTFPSTCLSPDQPGYGQVVASAPGRRRARRATQAPAGQNQPSAQVGSPVVGHHPHGQWSISPPPHHPGEMFPPPPPQYAPYPPHGSYPPSHQHSHPQSGLVPPPSHRETPHLSHLHLAQPHSHPHASTTPLSSGSSPSLHIPPGSTSLPPLTLPLPIPSPRASHSRVLTSPRHPHSLPPSSHFPGDPRHRESRESYEKEDRDREYDRRESRSSLSSSIHSHSHGSRYAPYPSRSPIDTPGSGSLSSPNLLRRESNSSSHGSFGRRGSRDSLRDRDDRNHDIVLPPITPITPASGSTSDSFSSLPSTSFGSLNSAGGTGYALPPISALEDLRGISENDSAAVLRRLQEPERDCGDDSRFGRPLPSLHVRPANETRRTPSLSGSSDSGSISGKRKRYDHERDDRERSRERRIPSSTMPPLRSSASTDLVPLPMHPSLSLTIHPPQEGAVLGLNKRPSLISTSSSLGSSLSLSGSRQPSPISASSSSPSTPVTPQSVTLGATCGDSIKDWQQGVQVGAGDIGVGASLPSLYRLDKLRVSSGPRAVTATKGIEEDVDMESGDSLDRSSSVSITAAEARSRSLVPTQPVVIPASRVSPNSSPRRGGVSHHQPHRPW
ncbi:hypothetical protein VKT23_016102 [Stygiomarasmius scandens]|uniref:HTH APSES-type domain-containing protein n=1 Tax=Marasmiellus scandens TaxID=2682957 RepID=A0ABR1IYW3_9AGAR